MYIAIDIGDGDILTECDTWEEMQESFNDCINHSSDPDAVSIYKHIGDLKIKRSVTFKERRDLVCTPARSEKDSD